MYHGISDEPESGRHPYYRTNTTPDLFARQMEFLSRSGYRTIGVADALNRINAADENTERLAVITFDDGYQNFYNSGYPVLERFGFTATIYLPTKYIQESPVPFKGFDCLTWKQVHELRAAGIEFGSHTINHPQLRELSPNEVAVEIQESKAQIEDRLGAGVSSFSYPYAFPEADRNFCKVLRDILCNSGYDNGVSTIIGTATKSSDRFFLERLPVNSCDDMDLFQAKLEGGYDWVHTFQSASKFLSRLISPMRHETRTSLHAPRQGERISQE